MRKIIEKKRKEKKILFFYLLSPLDVAAAKMEGMGRTTAKRRTSKSKLTLLIFICLTKTNTKY